MSGRLVTYTSAVSLRDAAGRYLYAREVEHSLVLGILERLCRDAAPRPARAAERPLLAALRGVAGIEGVVLQTPPHNLLLSYFAVSPAQAQVAADAMALRAGITLPGVAGPTAAADAFAAAWTTTAAVSVGRCIDLRLFQAQAVEELRRVPGRLRVARRRDTQLVTAWTARFAADALGEQVDLRSIGRQIQSRIRSGAAYLWEHDGQPVSMAAVTRPTRNGIAIGSVYTPPELRGNGYATACVHALTRLQLHDAGLRFVTLFTDLANPTSNRIYPRIGFRPVADYRELRFSRTAAPPLSRSGDGQ